ncbi:MAG TPA: thioesterase domain-containing protein [Pyrinomonadaceae bacterium]|jgi:medium-chain acyl-[acyl-carrier-protein] hydrolase|nr:thioesterase domain-containing protein [Pyrinomonadaceae bacterium]
MASATPWLIRAPSNASARIRLFCFPYAGGSAAIYRSWQSALQPGVEVCPVQLPGRGSRMREPSFTRIGPLLAAAAEALRPYMDMPFAFFGHSMGAIVSFELARLLRREYGLMPRHLFLSGRSAPQTPDADSVTYNLPDEEFVEELHNLGGTPKEVLEHPELLRLMMPVVRADFEVSQTYRYTSEPPLDCPFTVFGGLEDVDASRERLEAWREHTSGAFSLRMFPGNHFFLNTAEPLLLRTLASILYHAAEIGP